MHGTTLTDHPAAQCRQRPQVVGARVHGARSARPGASASYSRFCFEHYARSRAVAADHQGRRGARTFVLAVFSARQLAHTVSSQLSGVAPRQVGNLAPGPLPPSLVPRNFRKLKFMDIDPLELARQLTIMDGRLFARITPQECLGKAWPKQYGSEAPNISAMIDMSNAVRRSRSRSPSSLFAHLSSHHSSDSIGHSMGHRDNSAARRSQEARQHRQAVHPGRRGALSSSAALNRR